MLLAILKGSFLFFLRQSIIIMSRLIEFDLKNEIYNQYKKLDYAFFKKNNFDEKLFRGEVTNRLPLLKKILHKKIDKNFRIIK